MRIAYLDCFAGISGDMLLGALLDAGVPLAVMQGATESLQVGASLRVETVDRSGISSLKVHVMEGEVLAEAPAETPRSFEHQARPDEPTHSHHPKTQHEHKAGHDHSHAHTHEHDHVHEEAHTHAHGRSLTEIRHLIAKASLHVDVKRLATAAFELLGASEAKIHNVPVDSIHFHEVGAVDAIVDIVAASAGIHHLAVDRWYSSPVNVGGGMVQCAHGLFPVPAPATADLLKGCPTYSAHVQKELVTPTGAALLRMLGPTFGPQPPMTVEHIGYGAGTRNPHGFPNVLRLAVGVSAEDAVGSEPQQETITVLETALDDLSPQLTAHVAESALALGALDVMLTPVIMKKGRPGTLITLLCEHDKAQQLEALLLRETTTLGIRRRQDRRTSMQRRLVTVATGFGDIRIKVGSLHNKDLNASPEFEDCKQASAHSGIPLKQVQQAAMAAYLAGTR